MSLPIHERIARILSKEERIGVGLLSGTSADGVDAAVVAFRNGEKPRLVAFRTTPLPEDARREILAIESARLDAVVDLHYRLGRLFADAALAIAAESGVEPDFVGSHGQTVFHRSRAAGREAATFQIGEPAVIAARTGLITVADFRPSDVAAGGDGAPLVPLLDRALFASDGVFPRAIVNLGGIANLTLIDEWPNGGAVGSDTGIDASATGRAVAFDTGPANMPIDLAVRALTRGGMTHDADGRFALAGRVDEDLLGRLLEHPFLARRAPKTTGAQDFGVSFVSEFLAENAGQEASDLIATLTEFSAASLEAAYRREVAPTRPTAEVLLCGGGVHNPALVAAIRRRFAPIPVSSTAAHGVDPDAKEAILFAFLAHETLAGRDGNVPSATGARRGTVLGKIVCP